MEIRESGKERLGKGSAGAFSEFLISSFKKAASGLGVVGDAWLGHGGIGFHKAEDVALGIAGVGEPAGGGDGNFWREHEAAMAGDERDGGVERRHVDGAEKRGDGLIGLGRRADAGMKTAVDAGLTGRAGGDEPVGQGATQTFELPAKHGGVERDGAQGIVGLDFETDGTGHDGEFSIEDF